jgi:hypothetical protein
VVSSGEGPVDDLAADDDPAAYDPTAYDPAAYDPTGDDLAPDADSADDGGSGPAQSSYVTRSVGPRQQPRRDGRSTAARRPAGKKKRR